jgi:hypothetical protein
VVLTLQAFSWRSLRVHHLGRVVVLLSALPGAVCCPDEFANLYQRSDKVSRLVAIPLVAPRIPGVQVAALIE